jgi:hypothetical protein
MPKGEGLGGNGLGGSGRRGAIEGVGPGRRGAAEGLAGLQLANFRVPA